MDKMKLLRMSLEDLSSALLRTSKNAPVQDNTLPEGYSFRSYAPWTGSGLDQDPGRG